MNDKIIKRMRKTYYLMRKGSTGRIRRKNRNLFHRYYDKYFGHMFWSRYMKIVCPDKINGCLKQRTDVGVDTKYGRRILSAVYYTPY